MVRCIGRIFIMERRFVSRLSLRCVASRRLGVIQALVCLVVILFVAQAVAIQSAPSLQEPAAATQTPSNTTVLKMGKPIEREFAGRQKDIFQIPLAEGQYASVIIDHRAADLTIRLRDTQGIEKIETDSHPRRLRPIPIPDGCATLSSL